MFNNPYMNNYNVGQQSLNERIDNQIAQLQQMKEQMKNNQQPAINQTFQLAPTNNNHGIRYANTIEEVAKENIYLDTPFFSKDMSILWLKSTNGNIKTYELNEIIPKDSKDMQIELLQEQIKELKGMIKNDEHIADDDTKQNATNTKANDEPVRTTTKRGKSSSI